MKKKAWEPGAIVMLTLEGVSSAMRECSMRIAELESSLIACSNCGSGHINSFASGRDPDDEKDLCDSCYWRKKHDLLNNYIDRNFRNTCDWRPDNEGNFYTSCDGLWTFNEDGPVENGVMFCPYCGGNIELHNVERIGGPDA